MRRRDPNITGLTRKTAPAVAFLADADVHGHLRLPMTGSPPAPVDADLVAAYVAAAEAHLDGANGVLGRVLVTQAWEMTLARFPRPGQHFIEVPLPPLQDVTSITYVDETGQTQTLASNTYHVIEDATAPAQIVLAYGESWPATRRQAEAVTVTFTAGYGDTPADVPAPIRAAGLLMVADMYEHREAQVAGVSIADNVTVQRLLAPYRMG